MKKYLLPKEGKFYKANLHCHSTFSDGANTVEEIKKCYMEQGYSVVAYTDHELMIAHPELTDENFVALTAFEMSFNPRDWSKCCHINAIAPTQTGTFQPCFHRTKYASHHQRDDGLVQMVEHDENEPDFEREYSAECINAFTKKAQELGCYVTYNHPGWSLESYPQYSTYENLDALEIFNYGCMAGGLWDYCPRVYDDMLRLGKRIACVADDDNHCIGKDSYGGVTYIKAEKLDYPTIFKALKDKHTYASQGPQIYELYIDEENKVHIKCSDAVKILYQTNTWSYDGAFAEKGKTINEAVFKIKPEHKYFRITVIDKEGYPADTNAYFTDEWL